MQIPNGLSFYLPQLKWSAPRNSSFAAIVAMVKEKVDANPEVARRSKWPTSESEIARWVDRYNAAICHSMGWGNYIEGDLSPHPSQLVVPLDSPPPKSTPLLPRSNSRFARLVAGAKTLADWLGSGGMPVDEELAEKRAEVCVSCPENKPGDLGDFFTKGASQIIQLQLEKRKELKLSTKHDSSINVCDACGCPLKLKVHVPLSHIASYMTAATMADLPKFCWIKVESNDKQRQGQLLPDKKADPV